MTIQDRDKLFARCEGVTMDSLPNLLRAIVEALPVETKPTPEPHPAMPDCVRELVEVALEGHNATPSPLPPSECRICRTIAAVRKFYGEVQP